MKTFSKISNMYYLLLKKHPYKTNAMSTMFLITSGDAIAQSIIEKRKKYDFIRTLRMSFLGLFVGPIAFTFYSFMDKKLGPTVTMKDALRKLAFDQLVFTPLGVFTCISLAALIENRSVEEALTSNYFDILKTSYKIWPAVQFLNFFFVPLHYRIAVAQIVALFWNSYLMAAIHKHQHHDNGTETTTSMFNRNFDGIKK